MPQVSSLKLVIYIFPPENTWHTKQKALPSCQLHLSMQASETIMAKNFLLLSKYTIKIYWEKKKPSKEALSLICSIHAS